MSAIFTYNDNDIYSHHTVDHSPEPDKFHMHAHEWMEIFYIISGKGNYLVEGNLYPLQPGDIFIMRSSEAHCLVINPNHPYERISIHFSPSILSAVDPDMWLMRPFTERPLGQMNRFAADDVRFSQMRSAFDNFCFENIADVRINLIGRLLIFLTALNGVYNAGVMPHIPQQGLQSQLVSYVNEHLFEPMSLQSIAEHFYLSRSQIGRVFVQATGSSLWEYVSLKRLLAARAMIERGESANNACINCGFSDYSAFYRAYRTFFGHSPKKDAPKN